MTVLQIEPPSLGLEVTVEGAPLLEVLNTTAALEIEVEGAPVLVLNVPIAAAAGGGGAVSDGDKGDISVSGGGAVWSIKAGAVTDLMLSTSARALFAAAVHSHGISDVTGLTAALAAKQDALGFVPENAAQKGVAGGYAALDGTGRVPAAQLPSFVDDVIEVASFAALPVTGEAGKIYVTLDTNRQYRWSGTVYVEISASPGSTDAVPEGVANLYHTAGRVRATDLSGYAPVGARPALLTAGDTILGAFGKIGRYLIDLAAVAFSGSAADLSGTLSPDRIGAGALPLAKLADVATARFLGRSTAGAGPVEALTGAEATALLDTFTSGAKGLVPASGGGTTTFLRADGTFAALPGGGGSPGGATGEVQWNNAGAFAGAADVEIEGGQLRLPAIATPAAPAAGGIKLINWSQLAQADALAAMFSDGRVTRLQSDLADFQDFRFVPTVGAGALTGDGTLPLAATGTATNAFIGNATIWDKMPRVDARVTTAGAAAVAGFRRTTGLVSVGKVASSPGGFYSRILWGPGRDYLLPATHRACCGMLADTAAPTDVEPSTLVNGIWMGWNAADANVQLMHNDGTGAANKIDLGSAFPVPGSTADGVYMLELYSPNSLTQLVQYRVTRFSASAKTPDQTATGTITTDLPATSQFLAPRVWCSVGGTSSQVSTSLFGMHVRTEY